MTTESAQPLIGGTGAGNWPPSKDLGSYNSLPAGLSGEELAFMSNGGSIYVNWRDSVPNRSGSAPPSMEGSLAALGHLIGQKSGNLEEELGNLGTEADSSKSKEHLHSDPAYFEYYGSKVSLNPRLPPPIVSRVSRHLMNWCGKAREWRPFSFDSSSRSLFHRLSALSTHKEEPEDEKSPRLDSSSAEDAQCDSGWSTSNLGSHSPNLADLMQMNSLIFAFMSYGGSIYGNWRDSVPNRSGSAPPSMEGSLAALGHLIGQKSGNLEDALGNLGTEADSSKSKEHLHSDPAYFEYYGSKVSLNPRLPPPIVSREWWSFPHVNSSSSSSSSSRSLFPRLSALSTHEEEPEDEKSPRLDSSSAEDAQCDSGWSTSNLGSHSPNLADLMQENFPQSTALYDNSSDPSNTNPGDGGSIYSGIDSSKNSSLDVVKLSDLNGFPQDTHQWSPRPIGSPLRNTLSSNSLSASSPPASSCSDHNTIIQASQQGNPSMDIKPGGAVGVMLDSVDSSMKNLKISLDTQGNSHVMQHWQNNALLQNGPSHLVHADPLQMIPQGINLPQIPFVDNFSHAHMKLHPGGIPLLPQLGMATPFYTPSSFGSPYYQNCQSPSVSAPPFGIDGYGLHGSFLPHVITNFAPQLPVMTPFDTPLTPSCSSRLAGFPSAGNLAAGTEYLHPYKVYEQLGVAMSPSIPDLSLIHYSQHPSMHQYGGGNPYDTVGSSTNFVGNPAAFFGSQNVLSETIHQSEQRFQLPITGASSSPTLRNGGNSAVNYQSTSPYIGTPMPYPANPVFHGQPSSGTYPLDRRNDAMGLQSPSKNMSTSSGLRGQRGREKSDYPTTCSFVEELKSNRTHWVDLSDIKGHIMEYSSDQNGSRFIQQKLENCTTEEKALVFAEVLPHASSLMTDVFGNYVIQKLFERGSPEQRRDLASKLLGHVLPLSLQMYGCRVIQKALEAIELDQKIDLVRELDGHVLRCVRDQNGNHVIQKCIECVPMEHIGFIISSLQDHVANLSTHPYGCRVIQRILEHCSNDSEGRCIIDEILESVCILAQDQYGNYVTQHVLERGKAHERSQIISNLAGQVVSMSQNKYASNVIEKCFQHGDVAERDLLIKEILEQTEGNNYLLVMMKDRFANYVVQKILETCNEQQRVALLTRMKCHLQALRKFTYGKHIVSRVEQLSGDGAVQFEPR